MLSKEEVIKIAKLVRLKLTDAEIEKYQQDLSAILDYVEKLKEINTDTVAPLYQVTGLEHVIREDLVISTDLKSTTSILQAAPQGQENHQFLVKNVL